MCRAHRRGIDRETWSAATELAAAARLLNHQGMVNSISASASVSGNFAPSSRNKTHDGASHG
jgi:hypothetical protein